MRRHRKRLRDPLMFNRGELNRLRFGEVPR
jgi:hypothetical protein